MADALTVKPGPAPKLAPKAGRAPVKDAGLKREIARATAKAKTAPGKLAPSKTAPGTPAAPGAATKPPSKAAQFVKDHKLGLIGGVAASLIAAYIFMQLNGSGSGLPSTNSKPSNPAPGGPGTVPNSGSTGPNPSPGPSSKTTTPSTTTTTPKKAPSSYTKAPSSQTVTVKSHPMQTVGSKQTAANSTSLNTYARPVNKSGIPNLGTSPGAINPNYYHNTIPAGHSAQNLLPNLAPQIRRATNYGTGRAQPVIQPMTAAQRLNAAFAAYRRSHPGATSAQFSAALTGAAQAARNRSVTKGAGAANVTHTAYRTRATTASQVGPTKAYQQAHGKRSSYAPQIRALR